MHARMVFALIALAYATASNTPAIAQHHASKPKAEKPKSDAELEGLVYGATVIPHDGATMVWQKPIFWAVVVATVFFILNLIFW